MNKLGFRLQGARGLPALAIRSLLKEREDVVWRCFPICKMELGPSSRSWGGRLNESGVLEELDEDLVDKLVLSDGLDHKHPLLPEEPQHHGHFHLLQEKRKST